MYSFSYTTKKTNLHTTSAILGTIIIVIAFVFLIWCCIKIFSKKEPERIFPSVSTLDLRGIGNRQVEIEMEDTPHSSPSLSDRSKAGPSQSTPPPSVSGIKKDKDNAKDKTKKEDSKDKTKNDSKDKTKKEDSKDKIKKEDSKDKDKKEDTTEKKWWEKEISLSDLLRRQQKREDGKEKESEREKEKKNEKEKEKNEEKGEPEKGTKVQDESFYSPFEDED